VSGEDDEGIVVGGGVLGVPVGVGGKVPRDKARARVGVGEPAVGETAAELDGPLALRGVPFGLSPEVVGCAKAGRSSGAALLVEREKRKCGGGGAERAE
jgi:hypothetical protein